MKETALLMLGAVSGFFVCYYLLVDHFAARIETRVRNVIAFERNRFVGVAKSAGAGIGELGQGIASKISQESEKL